MEAPEGGDWGGLWPKEGTWRLGSGYQVSLPMMLWDSQGPDQGMRREQKNHHIPSEGLSSPANAAYTGLIPGLGRSPGKGNGYPLQYSWLGNPMDRGAWQATIHGVAKSQT